MALGNLETALSTVRLRIRAHLVDLAIAGFTFARAHVSQCPPKY